MAPRRSLRLRKRPRLDDNDTTPNQVTLNKATPTESTTTDAESSLSPESITERFPQEIMDMIYKYMAINTKIKPKPKATRAALRKAGLGMLFVNKTQSAAFRTLIYKHAKFSLPDSVTMILLLQSKARLSEIRHVVIAALGNASPAHSMMSSRFSFRLLLGALPKLRSLELVQPPGQSNRITDDPFDGNFGKMMKEEVEKLLIACIEPKALEDQEEPLKWICADDLLMRITMRWRWSNMAPHRLILCLRCRSADEEQLLPTPTSAEPASSLQTLASFDSPTIHEIVSWSATRECHNGLLSFESSLYPLRDSQTTTSQESNYNPGIGLGNILTLCEHVLDRPPIPEELLRLFSEEPNWPKIARWTTDALDSNVFRLFDLLGKMKRGMSFRQKILLDKEESFRLWSYCLDLDVRSEDAESWQRSYDLAESVARKRAPLSAWQRDTFFRQILGADDDSQNSGEGDQASDEDDMED